MADAPMVEAASMRSVRRRAQLPRRALLVLVGLLCLVAVRSMLRPVPAPVLRTIPAAAAADGDPAPGFAEGFARAYLTWDPAAPQDHGIALAPFIGPDIDLDAGLPVPVDGPAQRVAWTTAVGQTTTARNRVAVTVAVAIEGQAGLRYLAIPVGRDAGGRLAVTDYPAAVGPPALADELPGDGGEDLADTQLTAVVRRALGNYVAGAGDNLRADLAPGAQLRSPTPRMTLDDVVSIQRGGPQRVSAVIVARDRADVAYTLRYELAVVRRDRWYVAEINPPMTPKESR